MTVNHSHHAHGKHHAHKHGRSHKRLSPSEARAQERAAELPNQGTDEGALARLFIAEVLVPDTNDMQDARREMDMMHCVLMNRLGYPKDFDASPYASTITQMISTHEGHAQFQGFKNYPILAEPQQDGIDAVLGAALDRQNHRQPTYAAFVETAIAAAKDPSPVDPTPTGLHFWVTAGTHSPSVDAVLFQTVGGNDFHTWSKSKPKGSR